MPGVLGAVEPQGPLPAPPATPIAFQLTPRHTAVVNEAIPDPAAFAEKVLSGRVLDELVTAMLDHVVPPVFLDHDHPAAVRRPYETAVEVARTAADKLDPASRDQVRGQMPWYLQDMDLGEALVILATTAGYNAIPEKLFDAYPHPGSRGPEPCPIWLRNSTTTAS